KDTGVRDAGCRNRRGHAKIERLSIEGHVVGRGVSGTSPRVHMAAVKWGLDDIKYDSAAARILVRDAAAEVPRVHDEGCSGRAPQHRQRDRSRCRDPPQISDAHLEAPSDTRSYPARCGSVNRSRIGRKKGEPQMHSKEIITAAIAGAF